MANAHTKRAKGNWCQGKKHKGDGSERQFAKEEIALELEGDLTGLTKHRGKRRKNEKARLEYRIAWYEQTIEKYERDYKDRRADSFLSTLQDALRVAKQEYDEKYKKS